LDAETIFDPSSAPFGGTFSRKGRRDEWRRLYRLQDAAEHAV
jgi:hypothetical protein